MEAIIKLIILAYAMEGIKAADVAMLVSKEGGMDVFRCMAPQQHAAVRAASIKRRLERQLSSYVAEVHVLPSKLLTESAAEHQYLVVIQIQP